MHDRCIRYFLPRNSTSTKLLASRPHLSFVRPSGATEHFSGRKSKMKIPVLVVLLVAAMLAGLALIFLVL